MKRSFSCLFFILFLLCTLKSIRSDKTSINGLVLLQDNQSTPSLVNNNLILIIKNDINHDDLHHLQLKLEQDSFPLRFTFSNIKQIKTNGIYLLTLLIFGFTHRLLWEGILLRQYLSVNHVNNINFIVRDVSNLPKCLSPGYPCLEEYDMSNEFISMCCSNTKCQLSKTQQMTCGGNISAIHNVTITYTLPRRILPIIGLLDDHSVEVTEKIYQSILEAGTIVKINSASINAGSENQDVYYDWFANAQFFLQFHVSIMTSESCNECLAKILHSIQTNSIPFNVPLQRGSSIIVPIQNPVVNITDVVEGETTIKVPLPSTTIETTTDLITTAESSLVTSNLPTTQASSETRRDKWIVTGNMTYKREEHTATLLLNGIVLVAGGFIPSMKIFSAELYDPSTGKWTLTGNMAYPRHFHTATLLPNGIVLVAGGGYKSSGSVFTAELYSSQTGSWTSTGNMTYPHAEHTATLLPNGTVLVAGGSIPDGAIFSAELYDPSTGKWTPTGNMTYARYFHTANLLQNGIVLVAGGFEGDIELSSAELYDPRTGKWTPTGSMTCSRTFHTATLLPNGIVLVAGGSLSGRVLSSAELYDPRTGKWTSTGSMAYSRRFHTATLLQNGAVLVAGGSGQDGELSSAELYDPQTGSWTSTDYMTYARDEHTATLLPNGAVLVAGGYGSDGFLCNAELYYL